MSTLKTDTIRQIKASQRSLRTTLAFLKAVEAELLAEGEARNG